MRVLGAPTTEIVRAHAWATVLPIATLGCIASFVGWEVTRAMRTSTTEPRSQPKRQSGARLAR